jgi:hypothetical protein
LLYLAFDLRGFLPETGIEFIGEERLLLFIERRGASEMTPHSLKIGRKIIL